MGLCGSSSSSGEEESEEIVRVSDKERDRVKAEALRGELKLKLTEIIDHCFENNDPEYLISLYFSMKEITDESRRN